MSDALAMCCIVIRGRLEIMWPRLLRLAYDIRAGAGRSRRVLDAVGLRARLPSVYGRGDAPVGQRCDHPVGCLSTIAHSGLRPR